MLSFEVKQLVHLTLSFPLTNILQYTKVFHIHFPFPYTDFQKRYVAKGQDLIKLIFTALSRTFLRVTMKGNNHYYHHLGPIL